MLLRGRWIEDDCVEDDAAPAGIARQEKSNVEAEARLVKLTLHSSG